MICSFGDKQTEALFADHFVRQFQGVARRAKRKLEALNAASRLEDLIVPPSNRLERLKGDLKDFHSIRCLLYTSGTSRMSKPCSNGWPGTPRNRSANLSA